MKECRRFDTARSSVPLDFSFMGVIIISSTLRCIECSAPFGAFLAPAAAHFCVIVQVAAKGIESP